MYGHVHEGSVRAQNSGIRLFIRGANGLEAE